MSTIGVKFAYWYQRLRIFKYRLFSNCSKIEGKADIGQPVQFMGRGTIRFTGRVHFGVFPCPHWLNEYTYLESRYKDSLIEIDDDVWINNGCVLLSGGPGIKIGKHSMLGWRCEIMDTDIHDTHPERRHTGVPASGRVIIGENVLIGSNVRILKGVSIGDNSVVTNGSVLMRSIPPNTLAYGNPAQAGRLCDLSKWRQQSLKQASTEPTGWGQQPSASLNSRNGKTEVEVSDNASRGARPSGEN